MTEAKVDPIYSGRATNWTALGLTTGLLIPLLGFAGPGSDGSWVAPGFVIPLAVVAGTALLNLFTASSVRALAGSNGVTVHFGVFGWPRFRYPLGRIRTAEAIDLQGSRWTWGIHWSPRRGLMLTLRSGPALRLTLTNGRSVTISTPAPDDAVRVLVAGRDSELGVAALSQPVSSQ